MGASNEHKLKIDG